MCVVVVCGGGMVCVGVVCVFHVHFPHTNTCISHLVTQEAIPFAVVGSNTIIEVNNKKMRGRMYPWGVAEVENIEHCDFTTLRNMLVR